MRQLYTLIAVTIESSSKTMDKMAGHSDESETFIDINVPSFYFKCFNNNEMMINTYVYTKFLIKLFSLANFKLLFLEMPFLFFLSNKGRYMVQYMHA